MFLHSTLVVLFSSFTPAIVIDLFDLPCSFPSSLPFYHPPPSFPLNLPLSLPGRILNRFSKDIGVLDDSLPWTLFDFAHCVAQVMGSVVLVAVVNPWTLLAIG